MQPDRHLFLIAQPGSVHFTYSDLLQKLGQPQHLSGFIQSEDLFEFYHKLLGHIVAHEPVVLLDHDLTLEARELILSDLQKSPRMASALYDDFDTFKHALVHSTASITLFTSGTTGQPKKVTHPVQRFIQTAKTGANFEDNVWALAYHPTHMAGLQVFFQAILNGNTLVDVFRTMRDQVVDLLTTHQVTHISATPTFYRILLPADFSIPHIRRVTVGGEKSDAALYEKLRLIFPQAKFTNIYASTEAGSLFYADGDVFTVPEHLLPLIRIEDGELCFHASLLGQMDIQKTEWYLTGDVVEVVSNQPLQFRFLRRSNEMINVGGNKVNPAEVEAALLLYPGIRHAQVKGQANSILGQMLVAEIETYAPVQVADLRQFLGQHLQDYKIPRILREVNQLSVTRTGKLQRNLPPASAEEKS